MGWSQATREVGQDRWSLTECLLCARPFRPNALFNLGWPLRFRHVQVLWVQRLLDAGLALHWVTGSHSAPLGRN